MMNGWARQPGSTPSSYRREATKQLWSQSTRALLASRCASLWDASVLLRTDGAVDDVGARYTKLCSVRPVFCCLWHLVLASLRDAMRDAR